MGCQINKLPEGPLVVASLIARLLVYQAGQSDRKRAENFTQLHSLAQLVLWNWYVVYGSQKHHKTSDIATISHLLTHAKKSCGFLSSTKSLLRVDLMG